MRLIGNIIWMLFGGIFTAIYWFLVGCLFSITIVGIPLGRQAFKMASLTLAPFGKTIEYGGGAPSLIANVFWVICAGVPMALSYLAAGCVNCLTIVGNPLACRHSRWPGSRSCRLEQQRNNRRALYQATTSGVTSSKATITGSGNITPFADWDRRPIIHHPLLSHTQEHRGAKTPPE